MCLYKPESAGINNRTGVQPPAQIANPTPYTRGIQRLSPANVAIQSEMTNVMRKNKVIEYADSAWSTDVGMAKKRDTSDKRYTIDYKGLNAELTRNVICVPCVDDLLETWSKSK